MRRFSSSQTKIFVTTLTVTFLAGILVFCVINPLLAKLKNTQVEIKQNQVKLADISTGIQSFRNAEIKYGKVSMSAPEVMAIFPQREESVTLVEDLENAVLMSELTSRLTIRDSDNEDQPRPLETKVLVPNLQKIEEVGYSLYFSGQYRELVDLFLYLENLPFITEITKLSLVGELSSVQSGKSLIKTGQVTGELSGVFFLRKP